MLPVERMPEEFAPSPPLSEIDYFLKYFKSAALFFRAALSLV